MFKERENKYRMTVRSGTLHREGGGRKKKKKARHEIKLNGKGRQEDSREKEREKKKREESWKEEKMEDLK